MASERRLPERTEAEPIDIVLGLAGVLLLIAANGFYVAGEFALVAVERSKVEEDAEAGNRGAISTLKGLRALSFELSGAQLGITVTSLLVGFVAKPTLGRGVNLLLEPLGAPDATREGLSVGLALFLATALQMVFGELTPKNLAIARPIGVAYKISTPFRFANLALKPVIVALNAAADWTVRRLGFEPKEELEAVRSLEELELLVKTSGEIGALPEEEFDLLRRAISFAGKDAAEALVPRTAMHALDQTATLQDMRELAIETGHSRFPVYDTDLDNIVGAAHVKDVFSVPLQERAVRTVGSIAREIPFFPETRDLESVMIDMRRARRQLAIIVDEYGGTAGMITIEDLVEEIIGEIEDEFDEDAAPRLTAPLAGTHVLSGMLHLDEVRTLTGLEIPDGPYETLAGFVLSLLDRIPEPGDQLDFNGWELKVTEMERHRIAEVLVVSPGAEPRPEGKR